MEGSSSRTFPRMSLDQPVVLQIGKDTIRFENPANNLSGSGLFVRQGSAPIGTRVRVRIEARRPFEADGEICTCASGKSGVGIGFTSLSDGNREALDDLIEDLTLRGLPAA